MLNIKIGCKINLTTIFKMEIDLHAVLDINVNERSSLTCNEWLDNYVSVKIIFF